MDKSRSHDGLAMQGGANLAKSTSLRPWLVRKRAAPAAVLLSGLCMLFLFGGYASYAGFEGGTAALEVLLALAALVALRSAHPRQLHVGLATSIIAYFIVCGLYAVRWNSTNVLDYIQASKFLWYVLVVLVFSLQRKPIFDAGDVVRFSRFVLLIFFATYSVKRLALGQDHGLMVFAVCLYAVWIALCQLHIKARVCVTLVILLTGMSVSALNNVYVAMALTILSSGALHRPRVQFSRKRDGCR